jgi:hydroxyethylthiazole kinase-like uncharacterized protein yjeF
MVISLRSAPWIVGSIRRTPTPFRKPRARMQSSSSRVSYLDQRSAQQLDVDLMSPQLGFSIYQLMELAGLSCASAIREEYPVPKYRAVLVMCGPGNNGGDGLVCARHLRHFGYAVKVTYPKFKAENELYSGLVAQLKGLGVEFVDVEEAVRLTRAREANVVIDAMFGFSFTGVPRDPFSTLIEATAAALQDDSNEKGARPPFAVAAIDVPSGFHVEDGDIHGLYPVHPHMLISLTAPKLCAKTFQGAVHYLGGRFVPPAIAKKYNLVLPEYQGTLQCVKLSDGRAGAQASAVLESVENIRKTYDATVATSLFEDEDDHRDPLALFGRWFADAQVSDIQEPNAMTVTSVSPRGEPSTRYVLLRGYGQDGFRFFTNYGSRKVRIEYHRIEYHRLCDLCLIVCADSLTL